MANALPIIRVIQSKHESVSSPVALWYKGLGWAIVEVPSIRFGGIELYFGSFPSHF